VKAWIVTGLFLCAVPVPASWAATGTHSADALKRDVRNCRSRSDVNACYDAVRWSPSDPAIQMSLGDALMKAKRPSDALRAYHRASTLAPTTPGVAAKIAAAEKNASTRHAVVKKKERAEVVAKVAAPSFSNAAPEAQSH
jgi:cytochrome c-type biogenesis protein CcmH/NrfG